LAKEELDVDLGDERVRWVVVDMADMADRTARESGTMSASWSSK